MAKYKITFSYDGSGEIVFDVKDKIEAMELFYGGDWENKDTEDTSDNYYVVEINKIGGE